MDLARKFEKAEDKEDKEIVQIAHSLHAGVGMAVQPEPFCVPACPAG